MSDAQTVDFKPRARNLIIGDIPWLARIADKARAHLSGRLGDYIYPCPADQGFLREMGLSEAEFTRMIAETRDDDELIARMKQHLQTRAQ